MQLVLAGLEVQETILSECVKVKAGKKWREKKEKGKKKKMQLENYTKLTCTETDRHTHAHAHTHLYTLKLVQNKSVTIFLQIKQMIRLKLI